jgi:hypothetical protein
VIDANFPGSDFVLEAQGSDLTVQGVESDMVDNSAHNGVEISQPSHTSVEMVESSGMMETGSDVLTSEQVPTLEGDMTGQETQDDGKAPPSAGLAVLPDPESSEQESLKMKGPDDPSAQAPAPSELAVEGTSATGEASQAPDGQQVTLEGVPVSGELANGQVYGFITPDGYAVPFFPGGAMPIQAAGGQVRRRPNPRRSRPGIRSRAPPESRASSHAAPTPHGRRLETP